jgi:hypothetical protein
MKDPEQEQLELEIADAQAQIEARNAGVDPNAQMDPNAQVDPNAQMDPNAMVDPNVDPAAAQAAAAQAQPSPIEQATNGKFKSLEEFDMFLGEVEKLKNKPQYGEDEQKVVDLYRMYGPDAYRYLGMANTDVESMNPKDIFMQHFAIQNPELSSEEIEDGWEQELKKELGNPSLFIDFEDEESFGQGAFLKGKLLGLIGDKRKVLSDFYSNLVPSLLKDGQGSEEPGTYNSMPFISEEDKKAFAQEASEYSGFRPEYLEALGEGDDLQIAVNEIPGFAEVAQQIIENPQAFLEAEFMSSKSNGARGLNIKALLDYAASKAGNPLILQKYGHKIGEGRYADGLAEGTGRNADELRAKLGLVAKGSEKSGDDGLTPEQRRKAEIQAKADEVTRKMSGMA